MRSLSALLLLFATALGCAPSAGEESAVGSEQDLVVEGALIAASSPLLLAGDPYFPILDERPVTVDDAQPCVPSPTVKLTPGFTSVDASVVRSRSELDRSLELGVEGIPLARLGAGATASVRIFSQTKFTSSELHVFFAANGTFTSELVSLGAEPAPLRADRVGRCGWGYVKRAEHHLKAIVMVTLSATDETNIAALGCPPGNDSCLGTTSATIGPVAAKAALSSMLQRGSFNISIRTDADNISGLPALPLGSFATLSSTPESSADVIARLTTALDWLGHAQTAIGSHIQTLVADPTRAGAAPTTKVIFTHYPGITPSQKAELATGLDIILAQRRAYAEVLSRDEAWSAFEQAHRDGRGAFFNTPRSPASTVEELAQRGREARALIDPQRARVEADLSRCEASVRNDDPQKQTTTSALVASIQRACSSPLPMIETYESTFGVKAFAPTSMTVRPFAVLNDDDMCPRGQRLPRTDEIPLVLALSYAAPQLGRDGGLWIKRDGRLDAPIWVRNGVVESVRRAFPPTGLGMCFDDATGLFAK